MATILETDTKVYSQLVREDSVFVFPLLLNDFHHMEEVLGGDCIAIALPNDIILWSAASTNINPYKHTITIEYRDSNLNIFGNVIITSNDNDSLEGIQSLSMDQLNWLKENFYMTESEIHGNYILKFVSTEYNPIKLGEIYL